MKNQKLTPILFFTAYFVIGCFVLTDYGIGWDENPQRLTIGKPNWDYITGEQKDIVTNVVDKYHGPAWEIVLYGAERMLGLDIFSDIVRLRHFLNFTLFFIGAIFAYRTLRRLQLSESLSLLGTLLYVLMPRILEDSFINSKDTVFLSAITIANYFLLEWLLTRRNNRFVWFAAIAGFAMAIRITGIIVPVLGVAVFLATSRNLKRDSLKAVLCLAVSFYFLVLFQPVMWRSPLAEFTNAFKHMKLFPADGLCLYLGGFVSTRDLPWHYLPAWFIFTTPLFYLLLFVAGFFFTIKTYWIEAVKEKAISVTVAYYVYLLALFFAPFVMVILLHSTVYDGWRHIFFVFSPFAVLITIHLSIIYQNVVGNVRKALVVLVALSTIYLFFWNVKNHPHQNTYFNIAANTLFDIKTSFEMDYWGVGYKQAIERILKREPSSTVIYAAAKYPGYINAYSNLKTDKTLFYAASDGALFLSDGHPSPYLAMDDRIDVTAKYFISEYRGHPQDYPFLKIDSIMVDRNEIYGIYQLK